ncbi:tandem-95 repeat protein [Symbiobacterium terraclitae]|uniref:tandem-95 repeat protein n=1 Tax=Symbiobacterium terraclitae TaxID=557451 RepID=UPI0035B535A8
MRRVNRFAVALIFVLVSNLCAPLALGADQFLVQPDVNNPPVPQECRAGYACAQVFTASTTGTVERVSLPLARTGDTATLRVEVRPVIGGAPGGEVLAESGPVPQVPLHADGQVPAWTTIELQARPGKWLTRDKEYALVVTSVGESRPGQPTSFLWFDVDRPDAAPGYQLLEYAPQAWREHHDSDFAFQIEMATVNTPPTVLAPAAVSVEEDEQVQVPLEVLDEDPAGVKVTASSSNTAIVADSGLRISGTGAHRVLTIIPEPDAHGDVTITVTATDAGNLYTNTQVAVTVTPVNDPPSIAFTADLVETQDNAPVTLPIRVEGAPGKAMAAGGLQHIALHDRDGDAVTLSATTDNPDLISVAVTGTGASQALVITPVPRKSGTANVTLTASDGKDQVTYSFPVTVTAVNSAPEIIGLQNITIAEDHELNFSFVVKDAESAATDLTVEVTATDDSWFVGSPEITGPGPAGDVSVRWMPKVNKNGDTTIIVTVRDPDGGETTEAFGLFIRPVNDAPVLDRTNLTDQEIPEDGALELKCVSAQDPDGDALTLHVFSSNTVLLPMDRIEVTPGSSCQWTVTLRPSPNEHGETRITVQVSDGNGGVDEHSFRVRVVEVNDPPEIHPIPDVVRELGTGQFTVQVRVTDVESTSSGITVTASYDTYFIQDVTVGSPVGDRWPLYITPAGREGRTEITVRANDGRDTSERKFAVVIADYLKISGLPDQAEVQEDGTYVITFTVSPYDKIKQVTATSLDTRLLPQANVSLFSGSPGSYRLELEPADNQFGKVVVTVEAWNEYLATRHHLTLTVHPENDEPELSPIDDQETLEDKPITVPFYIYDPDPYDYPTIFVSSSNEQLVPPFPPYITWTGSGTDWALHIRPFKDAHGSTVITLTVQDQGGATASTSFRLTVKPVDDPPEIIFDEPAFMDEDTTATFTVVVKDVDSPPLSDDSLEAWSPDAEITTQLISREGYTHTYQMTVTPKPNKSGPIQIILTATSDSVASTRTVTVNVREINDPPELIIYGDEIEMQEDGTESIWLWVYDIETPLDRLGLTAVSDNLDLLPASSFAFKGSGPQRELVITPALDQYGTATVTVTLSDGTDQVSGTFTVLVAPVPDAPRVLGVGSEITINEDERLNREIEIYDPDSPMSEVEVLLRYEVDPANPYLLEGNAVRLEGSGAHRRLVVEPTPDESGKATIIITTRSNDDGASADTVIALTVLPVNDPPVLSEFTESHKTILEDESVAGITLTYLDIDSPASALTFKATSDNPQLLPDGSLSVVPSPDPGGAAKGTVSIAAKPADNRYGTATITLTVSDGQDSSSRSFRLTVQPVNDPPSFVKGPDQTVDEDAPPQRIAKWATGITPGPFEEDQKVTFEVRTNNPDLFVEGPAVEPDGTLTYTLAPDKYGLAEVEVRLVDDGGTAYGGEDASPWQKFIINVRPVNDAPVIAEIPTIGTEIGQITDEIDIEVTDVDSDLGLIHLTVTSGNTSLVPNDPGHIILTPAGPGRWKLQLKPQDGRIGTATITVKATDAEGATGTRTFDLIVNDLWLSGLVPSAGTMTPAFDKHVLSYAVVYSGWLPEVRVTATTQDAGVRLRVRRADTAGDWLEAKSGVPSPAIVLDDGGGDVEVEVYSPVTGIKKPYLLTFVRAKSTVAELVELSINPGRLEPEFRPDRTSYSATVPHDVTAVTVVAKPGDAWTKVYVDGHQNLRVGSNRITVTVLAENGERKVYTINVTREPAPLSIGQVEVETGPDWATLRFDTDDAATVTVYYRAAGGQEQSRSGGHGRSHTVSLTGLQPATGYTYRIHADRTVGTDAELVSAFRTEAPGAKGLCEVRADGALSCPATSREKEIALSVAPEGAQPELVATATVTDPDMGAAVAAALASDVPEAERAVSVRLANRPYGVALLEAAALQRAARLGVPVTVESDRGAVTLTPALVTDLRLAPNERLAVVISEAKIDPRYVEPWSGVGGYRQAGEPFAVSLARVSASGAATPVTTLPAPILISHPVAATDPIEAVTLAVFAQPEPTAQLVPLGGRLTPARDAIQVAQTTPGVTVLLSYENRFWDVPETHWAHEIVHEMAARQVLRGVTPTEFDPERPITRGQLAAILVRALKLGEDDRFARIYNDISPFDAMAGEIGGAIRAGMMTGYPDGTFRPDAPVTRQELAVVLSRMAGRLDLAGTLDREDAERLAMFADWGQIAPWAQDAVRFAVGEGLLKGRSADTFAPLELTTRAETATVIKRLLDKVAPGEWR